MLSGARGGTVYSPNPFLTLWNIKVIKSHQVQLHQYLTTSRYVKKQFWEPTFTHSERAFFDVLRRELRAFEAHPFNTSSRNIIHVTSITQNDDVIYRRNVVIIPEWQPSAMLCLGFLDFHKRSKATKNGLTDKTDKESQYCQKTELNLTAKYNSHGNISTQRHVIPTSFLCINRKCHQIWRSMLWPF